MISSAREVSPTGIKRTGEQLAAPDAVADLRQRLQAGGMGWGELKNTTDAFRVSFR